MRRAKANFPAMTQPAPDADMGTLALTVIEACARPAS